MIRKATLGDRLKSAREQARLTQIDVAKKLGVTNGAISGYERNYRDPDTETLRKLADLYGVTTNWVLGQEEKESAYALPESEYDRVISEVEKKFGVSLRDDPTVLDAIRNMIEIIARERIRKEHQ